jgi:NTE family protein
VGITEYAAMLRSNFPLSSKLSVQPMIYGRFVEGSDIPLVLDNFIGSEWFGHYVDGQVPFAGVGNLEMAWKNMTAAQMQLQFNPTTNNNILLRLAAGQNAPHFEDLLKHRTMLGFSLSYYYTWILGPLGGSIGYSNVTEKFYFYINLGYVF